MPIQSLETEPCVPSESTSGPFRSSSPPEIVLNPVNLGALPPHVISIQCDEILTMLGVDALPVKPSEFDPAVVSIRYDQLVSRPEITQLLRHCPSPGVDTTSIRLGATLREAIRPVSLRLAAFQPQDFSVRFDVILFAAELFSAPVNLDSFPLDALSIRFDEFSRLLDVNQKFPNVQLLPSDAVSIRFDVTSSQNVFQMLLDLDPSPQYVVSFPWASDSPPPGSVSLPMDADSIVSHVGYSAIVAILYQFATPDIFENETIFDAAILEKLLLCMRILPRTLRFPCDSAATAFHFCRSDHAVKIASIVCRITLCPCFEFNEDYGRTIVLLLDALLTDVRFPSIIFDVAVLLQAILERHFEYKWVLADYDIIGRLFLCLPQNRRVIPTFLVSKLGTLASYVLNSIPEIVDFVRTSFWVMSCRFAPDIAGKFLPIFTSLLSQTPCDGQFLDDCLTPEQFQQLHRKFLQEELRCVTKLSWFAFLAELLPRASNDFLKNVCLSPLFLEEFSQILELDDLVLSYAFLSAMEYLNTICNASEWAALFDELATSGTVPGRLLAFQERLLEANPPEDETQDLLNLVHRICALFLDLGLQ
jgi:hypothetical protein